MRTTLTIDDDLLAAVRQIADLRQRPMGEIVSDMIRQSIAPPPTQPEYRNGIRLIPRREGGPPSTLEIIKRLDEETPWHSSWLSPAEASWRPLTVASPPAP